MWNAKGKSNTKIFVYKHYMTLLLLLLTLIFELIANGLRRQVFMYACQHGNNKEKINVLPAEVKKRPYYTHTLCGFRSKWRHNGMSSAAAISAPLNIKHTLSNCLFRFYRFHVFKEFNVCMLICCYNNVSRNYFRFLAI